MIELDSAREVFRTGELWRRLRGARLVFAAAANVLRGSRGVQERWAKGGAALNPS